MNALLLLVYRVTVSSELRPRPQLHALQQHQHLQQWRTVPITLPEQPHQTAGVHDTAPWVSTVSDSAAAAAAAGTLTEDEVMWYFVQICLALRHLHGQGILHRDLKAANIFIAAGDIVKLGDFGISKVLGSQTGFCSTVVGTPYYLSPEICMGRPYNKKSDIWALGCVLYELVTQRRAFEGNHLPALVMKILKGTYPVLSKSRSVDVRELQTSLLQLEPRCRPTIEDVLRLPVVAWHLERYCAKVGCQPLLPALRSAGSLQRANVRAA
eukprot:CAMPEP_0181375704 /NCGR_PEP_ID=MMETSP1106-20121128/16886_1 /TAXON_ID=81844 /ORGANISM="Mantoniella antarctica, Strain SL-175" /LENGTH=267 /DNA_ID=CAMNT_0023494151 /DNA_START=200 /DNA_END=1001 /DNA_ORIENTATION=+